MYYLSLNLATALYGTLFVPLFLLLMIMILKWVIPIKRKDRYSAIDDYL